MLSFVIVTITNAEVAMDARPGGAWRIAGAWDPADGPGADGAPWGGIVTPWALYGRLKDAFDPARVLGPAAYARRA